MPSDELQRANEQIGSLRNQLHHAEREKRKARAAWEKLRSELCDYMDAGDMAVEAADFLSRLPDDAAKELRERIMAWHNRLDESEDGRREHAFYGEDDRKPHGSFKQ